ncbi:hypothetical protein E2C01_063402 [Portunus trituberculatus]|uniref:Uncharacterized protein n=1 Tax=Portunus trituberculatus TaxID=210409 RepID=A0A5B7HIV4_PORTR|nr:hypothetical protein [Portunus trituberculatus]
MQILFSVSSSASSGLRKNQPAPSSYPPCLQVFLFLCCLPPLDILSFTLNISPPTLAHLLLISHFSSCTFSSASFSFIHSYITPCFACLSIASPLPPHLRYDATSETVQLKTH